MINWIKRLRQRLIVIVLAVVLTLLVLLTSIVVTQINEKSKADYLNNSSEHMKIVANLITTFYSQVYKDINMLANNPLIQQADDSITSYKHTKEVPMTPSKNGGIEQKIYELFENYANNHEGTLYVYLATKTGGYIEWPETTVVANYDPTTRPWYLAGLKAKGSVISTDPYIHLRTKELVLSNLRSYNDFSGNQRGVIGIDIKENLISDMLNQAKIGKTGFYLLLHETGIIIADGHNKQNNLKNLEDLKIAGLNQLLIKDQVPFEITMGGTKFMVNPYHLQGTKWILASFIDKNELLTGAKNVSATVIVFTCFLFAIIVLLGNTFVRQSNTIFSMLYYDSLTGLNNRSSVFKVLDRSLTKEKSRKLRALMIISVDNFQLINNTYGHDVGDAAFRYLGQKFKEFEQENTIIGRMGESEFLLFTKNHDTYQTIDAMVKSVSAIFQENLCALEKVIYFSSSIGITLFSDDAQSRSELIRKADLALEKAKALGRNKFAIYEDAMYEMWEEKLVFQNAIIEAMKEREFFLNFQPYFHSEKNAVVGFEALIRWESQTYGYVSPYKLISNLEEMGLIIELGEWVLKQSCIFAKKINEGREIPLKISVNVSSIQLLSNGYFERTRDIVQKIGIPANLICLEVTETVLMESLEKSLPVIQHLRECGFQIALDDFGTGYSSLSYFNDLSIDILKIDKSFVDNLSTSNYDQYLTNVIINIAQFKSVDIIAEGVETEEQFEILKGYNCHIFQGFLFSKPLCEEAAMEFLNE